MKSFGMMERFAPLFGLGGDCRVTTERIGWGDRLATGLSVARLPLKVAGCTYRSGFGDHSQSRHRLTLPGPGRRFQATVGLDEAFRDHPEARGRQMYFRVLDAADGRLLWQSRILSDGDPVERADFGLDGATELILSALDPGRPEDYAGGIAFGHADWCEPSIELEDGRQLFPGRMTPVRLGIAFDYQGTPFRPDQWACRVEEQPSGDDRRIRRIVHTAPDGLLEVRQQLTFYRDFPMVEWLPEVAGVGDRPSGIISDFQALELETPVAGETVRVRRTLGTQCQDRDFIRRDVVLDTRGDGTEFTTDEGRSSAAWLPFFGVDLEDGSGFNVGIGWSGSWTASAEVCSERLMLRAGMKATCFRVLPGEVLRQPSIVLQYRECGIGEAQNCWRQFMLAWHSPRDSRGELIRTPLALSVWGGLRTPEVLGIIGLAREARLPYDTFWIDAGWYGPDRWVSPLENGESDWPRTVGDWRINPQVHPGGFREIAAAAHDAGMKFLLWVEIERIVRGTPVSLEHPEYFIASAGDPDNLMLNLGDPAARAWAVGIISGLIEEQGVDYYRQDFNFNTLPYWNAHDAEDRVGVTEMKYIAGLYEFWDELRRRYPDLLIDNCASGGRRIDLETASRSICLWRDDILSSRGKEPVNQNSVQNLTPWVPLHAGGVFVDEGDEYGFFSGMAAGVICPYTHTVSMQQGPPGEWLGKLLAHADRLRPLFLGDFHPLLNAGGWAAWQLAEGGKGAFLVLRHADGEGGERTVPLCVVDPEKRYRLEGPGGHVSECTGNDLAAFKVKLTEPRSCALYYYEETE